MGKFAVFLLLFAGAGWSASDEDAIQSSFVKPWVEALRSKDPARLERFIHPAVRACINFETKPFFENILEHEAQSPASGAYKVAKLAPMKAPPPTFLPSDDVHYPVQATYELQLEFEHSNISLIRFLAPDKGSWYEVYPCPNDKGMALFRQKIAESAEQEKKTAQLLAGLKDPLRGELKQLLQHQQKMDAIKKYQQATKVDLTTAVRVVNALQKQTP
jgi:hypothetical protein